MNKSFRDIIEADNKAVFLNPEEFGSKHTINGLELTVVLDDMELVDRQKKYKDINTGLHKKQLLFYVSAKDFGVIPMPGNLLNFDGHAYKVTDSAEEDGIYSVSLEVNR